MLQKDPSQRLTWPALLDHPFVKNRIVIVGEIGPTPFTTPLSASQAREKQMQLQNLAVQPTNHQSKYICIHIRYSLNLNLLKSNFHQN